MCFISDQLLVGSSTGTVTLWNVDSNTSIRTYKVRVGVVRTSGCG